MTDDPRESFPSQPFRWKAFGSGLVDPKNSAKALVLGVHQIIIVLIVAAIAWGIISLIDSQKEATPKAPTIINAEGAENIDNSTTKSDFEGFTLFGIKIGPFGGTNQ